MTNKERLISLLGFAAPDHALEGALIDKSVDPEGVYDSSLLSSLKLCKIEILKLIISTADTTNGIPGGFVIKYDRAAILREIKDLEEELGITPVLKPTITAPKVW